MSETGVVQAIAEIWSELPEILGEEWTRFEAAILKALRDLDAAGPRQLENAEDAVLALFEPYPKARERLVAALGTVAVGTFRGSVKAEGTGGRQRYIEVPVFYATDRALSGKPDPDQYYTGERGSLSLGIARVSIPDDHRMGAIEKPAWWRLEFRQDPAKHVVLLGLEVLDEPGFVESARSRLKESTRQEALIFIHGYNVSFADAARRAAQIAYDLGFQGLPMLYSWPSEGTTLRYSVDENNARWTLPRFQDFLRTALTKIGAKTVHTIAHSMGNRVLIEGLTRFDVAALPPGSAQLENIIFAAPDIDAGVFKDIAATFHGRANRFTLYSSSNDVALKASQTLAKYPRAGQSQPEPVIAAGVDTIDASDLDTGFMGHSYIGDNDSILSDVAYMIGHSVPPADRFRLVPAECSGGNYWIFKR
jgi:esterase/lipase superfamily enzyme